MQQTREGRRCIPSLITWIWCGAARTSKLLTYADGDDVENQNHSIHQFVILVQVWLGNFINCIGSVSFVVSKNIVHIDKYLQNIKKKGARKHYKC